MTTTPYRTSAATFESGRLCFNLDTDRQGKFSPACRNIAGARSTPDPTAQGMNVEDRVKGSRAVRPLPHDRAVEVTSSSAGSSLHITNATDPIGPWASRRQLACRGDKLAPSSH